MPHSQRRATLRNRWCCFALAGSFALTGCLDDQEIEPATSSSSDDLFVFTPQIWANSDIPVCWDSPGRDVDKALVRDALRRTWEAEANIHFTGFARCDGAFHRGLRVRVADEPPLTAGLGQINNNAPGGIVLNFDFDTAETRPLCPVEPGSLSRDINHCRDTFAIREFGRGLGFAHENDRLDTPCGVPNILEGNATVGAWDPLSIMNQCHPGGNGREARLSPTDIWGAQKHYGAHRPIASTVRGPGRFAIATRTIAPGSDLLTLDGASWSDTFANNEITSAPAVVDDGAAVHLIVRGTDGFLWSRRWDGGWTAFTRLGNEPVVGSPVAVKRGFRRVDVVVRGTDARLRHLSLSGTTWAASYTPIGVTNAIPFIGTPSMVARSNGRLDLVARRADNRLYAASFANGLWGAVQQLGTNNVASDAALVSSDGSNLALFVRGTDDALFTRTLVGSTWTPFLQLGPNAFRGVPSVVARTANSLDVFVRGTDGALYTKSWSPAGWTDYSQVIADAFRASPTAIATSSTRIDVLVRGTDDQPYIKTWLGVWGFTAAVPLAHQFK